MNGAYRGSLYLRSGRLHKAESCVRIRLGLSQNVSDLKTETIVIWRSKMQSQGLRLQDTAVGVVTSNL